MIQNSSEVIFVVLRQKKVKKHVYNKHKAEISRGEGIKEDIIIQKCNQRNLTTKSERKLKMHKKRNTLIKNKYRKYFQIHIWFDKT